MHDDLIESGRRRLVFVAGLGILMLALALSVAPTLTSWFTEPWDRPAESGETRDEAS